MLDSKLEPALAKDIVHGLPDTLHSEFHLSYNMLLNLLNGDGLEPETFVRASFRQFRTERSLPELTRRAEALAAQHEAFRIHEEDKVPSLLCFCPIKPPAAAL